MADEAEFKELEGRVAELTQRVYRLEQRLGAPHAVAEAGSSAQPVAERASAPPPPLPPSRLPVSSQQKAGRPPIPHRDLESRIGSQWLNRIGIIAILTGAAYFLKLAFDNNWIGPTGRIAIGLLAGTRLVAWSSKIHQKGYKYFSYSMTALGVGIMYLSLWAAFQLYHLLPAPVAFLAMIAVTVSAGMLALKQEAQILAAVAVAGGFATPALLSTGQNRPVALFSYIALLNAFAIVLVSLRPWRRLLLGSFLGTVIFYAGWFDRYETREQQNVAAAFATLFFLEFAILPVIKHLHGFGDRQWYSSKTFMVVALLNPAVYFIELFATYDSEDRTGLAFAAIGLGAFYIFLSKQLVEGPSAPDDAGIGPLHRWLHLAIAITFLTIAIPLKLHSHWVTMAWFVESAVLLWIGVRAGSIFLKRAAVVALALGLARMLVFDTYSTHRLVFNSRFATYAVAIAVLSAIMVQARREFGADHRAVIIAAICINALALLALNAEVADYYARRYQEIMAANGWRAGSTNDWYLARAFSYSALWMMYGAALIAVGFWRKSAALRWQALLLIAATIAKVFLYDLSSLSGPLRVLSFIALGALLMGVSFVYQKDWLKLSSKGTE